MNRGFTLIELLIVVCIVAILAAILVPAVQKWADCPRSEVGHPGVFVLTEQDQKCAR